MVLRECGICQSSIYPDEQTTTCRSCNLTFHAECWNENFGCAAYGCDQVDILKPKEKVAAEDHLPPPIPQAIERLPWNFVLLGVAAIAMAVSSLTFGIPSLLVMMAILLRRIQTKRNRDLGLASQPILLLAMILSVIGVAAGVVISRYWHLRE